MRKRVPQPPIDLGRRDPEIHDFWPGFVVGIIGLLVLICGALHSTGVETTAGSGAWEFQLVKAFSNGGIRVVDTQAPPPPPNPDDPAAQARSMEAMRRQAASPMSPRWKIQVDLGAKGGCPT